MMKRALFVAAFLFCVSRPAMATTYPAASCSQDDVEAKLALAVSDGDIVTIPSSVTPCVWTRTTNFSAPPNFTLQGATICTGSGAPGSDDLACTDLTIIKDGVDRSGGDSAMWNISTSATGTFRLTGITFGWNGGILTANGSIRLASYNVTTPSTRVDHVHFDHINALAFSHYDALGAGGVFDHILLEGYNGSGWRDYGDVVSHGDTDWHAATDLGQPNFMYFEDSRFTNASNDCIEGGRFIVRYSTFENNGAQTHPTGGSGRARGCRAWELYHNDFILATNNHQNIFFLSAGTGVVWENRTPGNTFDNFVTIHSDQVDASVYQEGAPPSGWGYCGPKYQTGTVSTAGTAITKTGGTNFSTSWPAAWDSSTKRLIIITDPITGDHAYTISSVASTTSLTTTGTSAHSGGSNPDPADPGTHAGPLNYVIGSNWNGNSDVNTGWPCIDQPGQGVGDLLSGDFTEAGCPTCKVINVTNGNAEYDSPNAWPRQALEPVYEWRNTFTSAVSPRPNFTNYFPDMLLENRDYYLYDTSTCIAGGACPSNVGGGTTPPTTCTVGTAFWRTDQQKLYKCTSTNTWTELYAPLTYPNPLRSCTPDHLAFTAQPSNAAVSAVLGTVSVSVEDSGNNVCTSATDTITIANKGGTCTGMTLGGTKSGAASSGLFDTTDLFENAAGACTLSATASGLTGADSDAFTISAIAIGGGGFGLHGR